MRVSTPTNLRQPGSAQSPDSNLGTLGGPPMTPCVCLSPMTQESGPPLFPPVTWKSRKMLLTYLWKYYSEIILFHFTGFPELFCLSLIFLLNYSCQVPVDQSAPLSLQVWFNSRGCLPAMQPFRAVGHGPDAVQQPCQQCCPEH